MADLELTYENMKKWMVEWWDLVPKIEGPQDYEGLLEHWAPGCIVRLGSDPTRLNPTSREAWVMHLCAHADDYRAHCLYKPYPMSILVDEREKTVVCLIKEQMKGTATGELIREFYLATFFELTLHEGKIKVKNLRIIGSPEPYVLKSAFGR